MEYVIREKKPEENLFQIEIYDCDFGEYKIAKDLYFESEAFAEKYGKENFSYENTGCTEFVGVMMKNGKEVPTSGNVIFGNANRPGEIYIVPQELAKKFADYLAGEGAALYKPKTHWFPKNYSFCTVSAGNPNEYCPFEFEWDDE